MEAGTPTSNLLIEKLLHYAGNGASGHWLKVGFSSDLPKIFVQKKERWKTQTKSKPKMEIIIIKKKKKRKNLFPPQSLIPPSDLMARIFSQLDCIDLLQCSLVCKQWYRDSTELREAWKNEYLEAYIRLGLSIKRETHPPSTTCSIRGVHSWCP